MSNQIKQLYTTSEAAELLPYKNAASVKARINEGKIEARKIGRDWFIHISEIKRINEEKNAKPRQESENHTPRLRESVRVPADSK